MLVHPVLVLLLQESLVLFHPSAFEVGPVVLVLSLLLLLGSLLLFFHLILVSHMLLVVASQSSHLRVNLSRIVLALSLLHQLIRLFQSSRHVVGIPSIFVFLDLLDQDLHHLVSTFLYLLRPHFLVAILENIEVLKTHLLQRSLNIEFLGTGHELRQIIIKMEFLQGSEHVFRRDLNHAMLLADVVGDVRHQVHEAVGNMADQVRRLLRDSNSC